MNTLSKKLILSAFLLFTFLSFTTKAEAFNPITFLVDLYNDIITPDVVIVPTPPVTITKTVQVTEPKVITVLGQDGIRGASGSMGPQGPQGIQGPQGLKGEKGDSGSSSSSNFFLTESTYNNQIDGILSSIEEGIDGVMTSIGTSVTTEALTVTGTTTFNTVPYTWTSSQGVAGSFLQNDGTGALSWASIGASSITADSLNFTELSDTLSLDASTDIAADNAEVLSITNTGTGNSFLVNDSSSDTTPFVIDASGNVGIGTTTPAEKLSVSGDIKLGGEGASGQDGYLGCFGCTGIANMYFATNLKNVSGTPTLVDTSYSSWMTYMGHFGDAWQVMRMDPGAVFGANQIFFAIGTNGGVRLGGQSTTDTRLTVTGQSDSFSSASVSGINSTGGTVTLSGADPTTYATFHSNSMSAITLTGTNANQTVTNAATLNIVSAPIKSTNVAVTNTHGILVAAGAVSTATNSYGLTVNAQTGASANYAAAFLGGNVGIGTITPAVKLHISGTADNDLLIGGDTHVATNGINGVSFGGHSNGNVYMNTKTQSSGKLFFRIGQGTEFGYARTWMTVDPVNGNVGILNTAPSVALDVTGSIEYTGDITDVSDRRLKENIEDFSGALDIISNLQAKSYNMIGESKSEVGFIAQDVRDLFPSATSIIDPENGYLGVSYVSLVPVVAQAVKELNLNLKGLEARVAVLEAQSGTGFLGNIFNVSILNSDKVQTKELCVGEVCVSEEQFLKIVNSALPSDSNNETVPVEPTPEPEVVVDEVIEPIVEPEEETVIEDPAPVDEVVVEEETTPVVETPTEIPAEIIPAE